MDQIIESIYNLDPAAFTSQLIAKVKASGGKIDTTDEDDIDLLHHCIFASNPDVAKMLLMMGYFQHSTTKTNASHMHLACFIGRAQLITALYEFKCKQDIQTPVVGNEWINTNVIRKWLQKAEPNSKRLTKLAATGKNEGALPQNSTFMPLDTAAIAGNLNCVKTLLSLLSGKSHILETAVIQGSHVALELLLKAESYSQDHVDVAFKSALRHKQPLCLDILLQQGVNVNKILNGLNPYHVVFMYSSAFQQQGTKCRNKGLDECIKILAKHDFDVNDKESFGAYPLYSCIHAIITEKDQFSNKIPIYNLNSLKILLDLGADPNFDEQAYFNNRTDIQSRLLTLGRALYSSAFNALFSMLQSSDTWAPYVTEPIDKCCLLLLEHGANLHTSSGEPPLHQLVSALAMQHAMGHMYVDFGTIIRMMLFFGADPETHIYGAYAVNYYFKILTTHMGGLISFQRWKSNVSAPQILQLLYFMDLKKASMASNDILETLNSVAEGEIPDSVVFSIRELIEEFVYKPKNLQELCKLTIWRAIGRKKKKLKNLPLPKSLARSVVNIFMLDLDL